jgi:hypothetical protein
LHESVELPDPATDVLSRVHTRLVEFVVTARVTLPTNPFIAVTSIVEFPVEPAFKVMLVGFAFIPKS